MTLIGLTGYATSGKSEAARLLNEEFGLVRISYSDPLYEAALAIDPLIKITGAEKRELIFDRDTLFLFQDIIQFQSYFGYVVRLRDFVRLVGMTEAKRVAEVRRLLQVVGTEAGRDIHGQDCWIRIAERKMLAADFHCVFENVRFVNEAQMVLDAGGIIIRIERPGVVAVNSHVSDAGLPAEFINCTIVNDGTLEDLRNKVRVLLGMPKVETVREKKAPTRDYE